MSEPMRMAPPRLFLWHATVWLAAILALLALLFPLATLAAAASMVLALVLGMPTCRRLLKRADSRRVTRWWLGLSAVSLVALLANWLLIAMPVPRYADYFPAEQVSPLRQAILENSWTLHWAASGTAALAAIAGMLVLAAVMQKLRAVPAEPALNAAR
ncbi:hypothetical protein ACT3TS_01215 [Specibacter sp. AOP5-B1-6]|uniref:hypothetical protein n=1 Tax=Specibacter sp. AOP5-B1-6 TaxID=3457653 RepID=UPI003FB733E0